MKRFLLFAVSALSLQAQQFVVKALGTCRVVNPKQSALAFAFKQDSANLEERFMDVVIVEPGASEPCPRADLRDDDLFDLQVLDYFSTKWEVGTQQDIASLRGLTGEELRRRVASLVEDAASQRISNTSEAEAERDQARAIAQLELAQRMDELQFRSFNAVDANQQDATRRDLLRQGNLVALERFNAQARREQANAQMAYTLESAMNSVAAFAAEESVKRNQLGEEARLLRASLDAAEEQKKAIRDSLRFADREAKGRMLFLNTVTEYFERREPPVAGSLRVVSLPKRVFGGRSGKTDVIELEAEFTDEKLAVLTTTVEFDKGGSHKTILRRLEGSNRWQGSIVWPVASQKARLTVRTPGTHAKVKIPIDIVTGREALVDSVKASEELMSKLKKQFKQTEARSQGSDTYRTVPIP